MAVDAAARVDQKVCPPARTTCWPRPSGGGNRECRAEQVTAIMTLFLRVRNPHRAKPSFQYSLTPTQKHTGNAQYAGPMMPSFNREFTTRKPRRQNNGAIAVSGGVCRLFPLTPPEPSSRPTKRSRCRPRPTAATSSRRRGRPGVKRGWIPLCASRGVAPGSYYKHRHLGHRWS